MSERQPYPGLRPFNRQESDLFFGREEQLDELLRRLDQHRFLAMVGGSGCGKSSLVRSGLIAALESGFMANAGARWCIAIMRPGSHPMERLVSALLETGLIDDMDDEDGDHYATLGFLRSTLNRGPRGLTNALQHNPLPKDTNFLLVVDQFEELFRISRGEDRDQADAFVSLLLESASQSEVPIHVVMTMRSDFLGDTALFSGLPEAVNDGIYLIPRLSRNQRKASIEGPARVVGGEVQADLVNRLLNDMAVDATQLPLLQHLLMRMWQSAEPSMPISKTEPEDEAEEYDAGPPRVLSMELYDSAGKLGEALNLHAEDVYQGLDANQQKIAKVMFNCLCERSVSGDSTRNIRRPTSVEDIAAIAGFDTNIGLVFPETVIEVADKFRADDCHFITPSAEETVYPNTLLDLSHEALMLSWKRLSGWMDERSTHNEIFEEILKDAKRRKRHLEKIRWRPLLRLYASLWGGKHLWLGGADYYRAKHWKEHSNRTWAVLRPEDNKLVNNFVTSSIRKKRIRRITYLAGILVMGFSMSFLYKGALEQGAVDGIKSVLKISTNTEYKTILAKVLHEKLRVDFENASITDAVKIKNSELEIEHLPTESDFDEDPQEWVIRSKVLLDSECSSNLKKMVGEDEYLVEVFVTDKYGYNVCMSARTSDFIQSDEAWWDGVYDSKKSNIGEIEWDASAETAGIAIYSPVNDEAGELIGVAKAVFDLRFIGEVFCDSKEGEEHKSICEGY